MRRVEGLAIEALDQVGIDEGRRPCETIGVA
jgi:hypothetical protein